MIRISALLLLALVAAGPAMAQDRLSFYAPTRLATALDWTALQAFCSAPRPTSPGGGSPLAAKARGFCVGFLAAVVTWDEVRQVRTVRAEAAARAAPPGARSRPFLCIPKTEPLTALQASIAGYGGAVEPESPAGTAHAVLAETYGCAEPQPPSEFFSVPSVSDLRVFCTAAPADDSWEETSKALLFSGYCEGVLAGAVHAGLRSAALERDARVAAGGDDGPPPFCIPEEWPLENARRVAVTWAGSPQAQAGAPAAFAVHRAFAAAFPCPGGAR